MIQNTVHERKAAPRTFAEKYDQLYDKINKTARCRFISARRLEIHETLSLCTVVIMSCCVIGLTLLDALMMLDPDAESKASFLQIFCSVGVLVYSVIVNRGDFALRAYRHHECGTALNAVRNRMFRPIGEEHQEQFVELSEQYATVLERHENHLILDFQCMQVQSAEFREYYKVTPWFMAWVWVKWSLFYLHYVVFSLLAIAGLTGVYLIYGQ